MGNFEKLVVLAVLFVAAVVLAISFNRGGDEVEAADPLSGARQVLQQEGVTPVDPLGVTPAPVGETLDGKTETSLLLNAGDEFAGQDQAAWTSADLQPANSSAAPTLTLEPEFDRSQRILGSAVGLRPSFADDYMVYTVVEGDTWSLLAQRFYQDGRYTRNLMRANDDPAELTPGTDILVPLYDLLAVDAGLRAGTGTSAPVAPTLAAESAPRTSRPTSTPVVPAAKLAEYEVKPGDTLSDISLAVFGTATRWKELLEANHDKLRTPEALQVGMKLKIPEGGKLPTATASPAVAKKTSDAPVKGTKPAAAAATASKEQPAPKKKKVL